jgi:hypothetical protein
LSENINGIADGDNHPQGKRERERKRTLGKYAKRQRGTREREREKEGERAYPGQVRDEAGMRQAGRQAKRATRWRATR